MEEHFELWDTNGDGLIATEELGTLLGALGYSLTKEELEYVIKQYDTNRDGELDFNEFLRLMVDDSVAGKWS